MHIFKWVGFLTALTLAFLLFSSCGEQPAPSSTASQNLKGASSYTPYDAIAMLWTRDAPNREMVWTSSGGESGRLLVSSAGIGDRPDWVFCTQGVVAGLAARGEDIVIIGSVYISDDAILPVFRKNLRTLSDSRSLYIPRSSIEFAFDRLLQREGLTRNDVAVPSVEQVGFSTITSLLTKPADQQDALDFGILVDPFITNIMNEHPGQFEIGEGGLYNMHYSIVVRKEDLEMHREAFVELLRQMVEIDTQLNDIQDDSTFYRTVWGREKDGQPEYLPQMMTYKREPARLQLQVANLRQSLQEEIDYLVGKYPEQLQKPSDIDGLVDPSILTEVDPSRVVE